VDAYHDLAEALATAAYRGPGCSPQRRLRALADAWREFARAQPHRYRLLFGPPEPGYDAHSEPLATASSRAMAIGLDVFAHLGSAAGGGNAAAGPSTDPELLGWVLSAWCRLHGFASLELGGNFAAMGIDADELFRRELDALLPDHAGGPSR
jgi:hypothetical protein